MPTLIPIKESQIKEKAPVVKQGLTPVKLSSLQGLDQDFSSQNFIGDLKLAAQKEKEITDFKPSYFNGLNDDEERIVNEMEVRGRWTKAEAEYAKQVMKGETPEYKKQLDEDRATSAFGFYTGPVYYFDPTNKGLPKILKNGEKVPENTTLESFWGANKLAFEAAAGVKLKSKIDAENDNFLTTSLKGVVNTFMNIVAIPTEVASAIEGATTGEHGGIYDTNEQIEKMLDQLHMATSSKSKERVLTDKFKDFSDFFNSESYNITSQNLASFLGQAVGSLLQFGTVGKIVSTGAKAALGATELSLAQRIGSGYMAGVMVNLGQTIKDAEKGKVTPREAALMGLGNAMIYSVIEQVGGGPEARFLRGMEGAGTFRKMNKTLLTTIRENGGVINPEVLKKAFTATLETGLKEVPKAKIIGKDILKETGEETLQEMESRGSEQLFNAIAGYNAYEGTFGDTEHLKGYFENALGGALGGAFGGAFQTMTGQHKEYDETDAHIYDYVRMGKTPELKQELMNMQAGKKISTDDVKAYSTLIDAYEGYYKQLSNKNLPREDGAKVFENAFNIEHLHGQASELEKQPTISPIQKGEVDVLRSKANELQKEINSILKGEKTFVEKNEETTLESADDASTPVDVHTIETKKWIKMKPSERKKSFVSHLKTQETPITGTVHKKPGSVTAYSFNEPNGKFVTFYSHADHDKITEEDLKKPAQLVLTPEVTNAKGQKFTDVVQVKIGDKIVGNVQETDFEKSAKSATESEIQEVPTPESEPLETDTFTATSEEKNIEKGIHTGTELSSKAKKKMGKLGFSTGMLNIMSKEDLETAKTFNSPEDAIEMVDKYAKRSSELEFHQAPVTTYQKKKAIPKSRKTIREMIRDPESLDEAIVQTLLTTRIKTEDLIRHTGFGKKNERTGRVHGLTEFRKLIWAHKKAGVPLDMFVELMPSHFTEGLGAMDLQNKILELLQSHPSKTKLIEKLEELQKEKVQDIAPEDIEKYMEDEAAFNELKGLELPEVEISDEVIADIEDSLTEADRNAIDAFLEKHTDGKGNVNWEEVKKALDSDEIFDLPRETTEVIDNLIHKENESKQEENKQEGISDTDGEEEEEFTGEATGEEKVKEPIVTPYTDPYQLEGVHGDHIIHMNQGFDKTVTLLVDPEVKQDYVEKSRAYKRSTGDTKGFKHPLKDIAKKYRDSAGVNDVIVDLRGIDLTEIKYQSPSNIKEIEGKLDQAKKDLESAKKKVISKRTELLRTKLNDTEDLFGEKKSEQEQQLFYQQTEGDIEKILQPQKDDVIKAESEVERLKKQLEAAKGDNSQTEMKFQGKEEELLATDNPRLATFIRAHLKKLFPKVQVFGDAEEFQKFLDRNYPGKKLDLTKLGATIGNAIYINPDSAVQSTAIHEHAHIYWDMLPEDLLVKENLLKMFNGDEEAVITAIGQAGVDMAQVKLDGGKLARFISVLKTFWAKVKEFIGIANKKDLTRIMADAIWKNAHKIQAEENSGVDVLKFMSSKANDKQQDVIRELQSFNDYLTFDEKEHKYFNKEGDVEFTSVTTLLDTEPKYKFEGINAEDARLRGKTIDEIVEAVIKGTDPLASINKYGITMDQEAVDDLIAQIKPFIENLKKDGEVLSQVMIANNAYKVAGRQDIIVVRKDGTIDIYDVKASKTPTTRASYSKATIYKGKEKAAKKDLQGVQMGMYGNIMEAPDMLFGQTGKKIGKLVVVPIKLEAEGKTITGAIMEPLVESDYQQYKNEAERILDRQLEKNIEEDEVMNTEMEALTQKQYFDKSVVYVNDEKMSITQFLKKSENKVEDKKKFLDQYKRYTEQLKNAKQITINIETATSEQLNDIYNLIHGYDNLVQNKFLEEVSGKIREALVAIQKKRTGVKDETERPFTRAEAYFTRPSKVTEEHPYIQAVAREKLLADEENLEETNKIKKEFKKYSDALKKEKRKGEKLSEKVLRKISIAFEDKAKYFKNLIKTEGGKLRLKNYRNTEEASGLTEAEFNYLKFYTDTMERMYSDLNSEEQLTDGFFPQLSPKFFETAFNTGFMKAVSDHFYNDRLEDVVLNYEDNDGQKKFMRYEEVVDTINHQADNGIIEKATKAVRLRNVRERAEKAMANRKGEDGKKIVRSETTHRLIANGKLVPRVLSEKEEGQAVSLDLDRAFTAYVEDMNNVKYMNKVIPFAMSLWDYYKKKGSDHEFTKKFLNAFIWGDIVGRKIETTDRFTKAVRFAQMWTYLNVMTFNLPAAFLNISQGVSQLIKHELFVTGSKRFFGDWKKAQAVIDKYNIVSVEHGEVFTSGAGLFTYLANGANLFAETYLQGAAFIGGLTEEQWDNFNADGTVKDDKLLPSKDEVAKLKSQKNDMMGAYDQGDKRMYKHWALGSAAMQFKGWMPDWIDDRLQKSNTDVFGVKKKGSWRSLKFAAQHLGELLSDPKTFFTSQDPDAVANRGHLKNAMYVALLLSMATGASEDDEDRKLSMRLWRAVNDMSGVFNLSSMDFIVTQPMPFLGTVHNFIGALKSIPDTYDKSGRFGDKGDWMFPGKVMNVLPYNHLGKSLFTSSNYK